MTAKESLTALPSHCVRPLAPFTLTAVEQWAQHSGQHFVAIDLSAAGCKKAVLQTIGRALGFPGWYGANLDALYDCLTDLPESASATPWLIVLSPLAPHGDFDDEQRQALLDVFRDALEPFADAGLGLRVLYAP